MNPERQDLPKPAGISLLFARRAALWALAVIFAANFLNYIDRTLVSALEGPLEDPITGLGLAEYQFGLLWSLFTIGYMLCAVPIGLLADRLSRTRLFALCIVVWSIATLASGWAPSRHVLYVARIFIGVGEAGCLVIGPSLVSDLFAKEVRGMALSIFYLGMPLGGTAAYIIAGALLQQTGWRSLFFLAGLPGFVIAALIFLMIDPPRGSSEGAKHGMKAGGVRQYVQLLKTRTLLLIILAQAFAVFILVPLMHFGVKFFEDARGMDPRQARLSLGLIALIAGALGSCCSGPLGDWLYRRLKGAYALMAGIGYLLSWPCFLIGFNFESPVIYLTMLTLGAFFLFLCMPAVNTQIANVTSPAQRATAWALAVFILHLLGDTVSPWLFGKVINVIPRQQAFSIFSTSLLLAGACCLIATVTATRDAERVERRVERDSLPDHGSSDGEVSGVLPGDAAASPIAPASGPQSLP
jgi:predicted MFS family arabinose efflux permease